MNIMKEEWKDIDGYEGLYKVSNLGRVKSMNYNKTGREKCLKSSDRKGYDAVILSRNGNRVCKSIHRLVLEAFTPNPNNKPQVNHIDGDKKNNNVNNLEWCTAKENTRHSFKNGLQNILRGSDVYNSRLSPNDILQMRSIYDHGWANQSELADAYNISFQHAHKILRNKVWRHI